MAAKTSDYLRRFVRAELLLYKPPGGGVEPSERDRIGKVPLHFNPESLTIDQSCNRSEVVCPNTKFIMPPEFINSQPRECTLEIFLDTASNPLDTFRRRTVQQQVEKLFSCVSPQKDEKADTPWVKLSWGKLKTTAFFAVVKRVKVTYTLFALTGDPLRAECQVTLSQASMPTPGQNPTSRAKEDLKVHLMVDGDSLASIAHREYGDPAKWREIARANDLDDVSLVRPGARLGMPELDGVGTDAAQD